MKRHGLRTWDMERALDEALKQGMPQHIIASLETINREATRLMQAIRKEKAANE